MASERKHDDETIFISSSVLANVESILQSQSSLQLLDVNTKEPDDDMQSPLLLKNENKLQEIKNNKIEDDANPTDIEEVQETFVLELPREMLTAYILLCFKDQDDWDVYGCCGQSGIFIAYLIPFGIQIIVTFALMSELEPDAFVPYTSKEQILFNLCALSILFIYIFDKTVSLFKSTWTYLNKLQLDEENKNNKEKRSYSDLITPMELPKLEKIATTAIDASIDLANMSMKDVGKSGKTCAIFWAFKLQIICVFIMHFALMLYAMISINRTIELAEKLEVAVSIFFVLEVDDWAYELFIAQNMMLRDSDFDIEMIVQIHETKQTRLKQKRRGLWCSLTLIVFCVASVIGASVLSNDID